MERKKWFCKYPPATDYKFINSWVQDSQPPKQWWARVPVRVLKESVGFKQGMRRLERSYADSAIESTSADDNEVINQSETRHNSPTVLSNVEQSIELKRLPPFLTNSKTNAISKSLSQRETTPRASTSKEQCYISSQHSRRQSISDINNDILPISNAQNAKTLAETQEIETPHNRELFKTRSKSKILPTKRRITFSSDDDLSDAQTIMYASSNRSHTTWQTGRNGEPSKKRFQALCSSDESQEDICDDGSQRVLPRPHTTVSSPNNMIPHGARYNLHQELQEMENKILRNLQSVKRSILYDFDKKIQDLKRTMTLNTISVNDEQSMENFGYVLPIPDLANFLEFEEDLTNNPEKLQRLKRVMITFCYAVGEKEAISKILKAVLSKIVQKEYSACGRKMKGEGKRNFSETNTYKCMKCVLSDKYHINDDFILSRTSRWLSGAADREGGRKEREMNQAVPNEN